MSSSPHHLSCQQLVELVSDYLERALSAEQAALFEQHLAFCGGCEAYVEQVRVAIDRAGRLRETAVPAELRARLLEAFRAEGRP